MLHIRDNGIGITENDRDRVFDIFSRLHSEKAYGPGTGTGLSFVRKIIKGYGCELTFSSELGVGTTFYFSLPLTDLPVLSNNEPSLVEL